jgi:hypothetical protein
VEVQIQIERAVEALVQGGRAGLRRFPREVRLLESGAWRGSGRRREPRPSRPPWTQKNRHAGG